MVTRGWRRFRRLPAITQAGTAAVIVAAYTIGLVLLVGGGGDSGSAQAEPVAKSSLDKAVTRALEGVKSTAPSDATDVPAFRRPMLRRVRCEDKSCDVVYSVGLPGRGRILQDQRPMLERLYSQTDIVKVKLTVTRDTASAGVPAKSGEETPGGAPLIASTCDRTKAPADVEWSSASGAQILQSICDVSSFDQGKELRQEPVAKDDPAIKNPQLPEPGEK